MLCVMARSPGQLTCSRAAMCWGQEHLESCHRSSTRGWGFMGSETILAKLS